MAKAKFRRCRFKACELSPKAWAFYKRQSEEEDYYFVDGQGRYYVGDSPDLGNKVFIGSNINDVNLAMEAEYDRLMKEA